MTKPSRGRMPASDNVGQMPATDAAGPVPAHAAGPDRHHILVCQACRHTGSACLPGIALLEKLRAAIGAAGMAESFEVSGTACLAACARRGYQPCTVAWRANAKTTWAFGDIEADADIEALIAFSQLYAARENGWAAAGDWPESLRDRALSRVPAAMVVTGAGALQ